MKLGSLAGMPPIVCGPELTLSEACEVMLEEDIGSILIVEGAELLGILTDRDLVRATAAEASPDDQVSVWMTRDPDTFHSDTALRDAVKWILDTGYRHMPVVDEGAPLAVVSIKDLLFALSEATSDPAEAER